MRIRKKRIQYIVLAFAISLMCIICWYVKKRLKMFNKLIERIEDGKYDPKEIPEGFDVSDIVNTHKLPVRAIKSMNPSKISSPKMGSFNIPDFLRPNFNPETGGSFSPQKHKRYSKKVKKRQNVSQQALETEHRDILESENRFQYLSEESIKEPSDDKSKVIKIKPVQSASVYTQSLRSNSISVKPSKMDETVREFSKKSEIVTPKITQEKLNELTNNKGVTEKSEPSVNIFHSPEKIVNDTDCEIKSSSNTIGEKRFEKYTRTPPAKTKNKLKVNL